MSEIFCNDYTEKSIIVHGETREHKDNLKLMGGKFNMNLNDPSGSEKIPGWIFPKSKESIVKSYIETGKVPDNISFPKKESQIPSKPHNYVSREEYDALLRRIEKLENIIKILKEPNNSDEIEEENYEKPHRRLLKKKK